MQLPSIYQKQQNNPKALYYEGLANTFNGPLQQQGFTLCFPSTHGGANCVGSHQKAS